MSVQANLSLCWSYIPSFYVVFFVFFFFFLRGGGGGVGLFLFEGFSHEAVILYSAEFVV